jgi:hypothetical protein
MEILHEFAYQNVMCVGPMNDAATLFNRIRTMTTQTILRFNMFYIGCCGKYSVWAP